MKSAFKKFASFTTFVVASLMLSGNSAKAVNYAGNGNTGFGGTIGNGILSLTDDGTNISGHLTFGGTFNNVLVIYVDTGAAGGFTSTTNFNDQGDGTRKAISGVNGTSRSLLTFTNGFTPTFAVGISSGFGGLWQLAAGGNNSLPFVTSVNYDNGTGNFSIPATSLGLTNGQAASIRIFGTYISDTGYRSTEAICGNILGLFGQGWNPFSQTAFATYNFATPPPPTYPVTFSVDMTAQVLSGAFMPSSGDTVYCGGSFQTNPFAFSQFQLAPSIGNTNIYVGTYQDPNPTNTVEQYKFMFISLANSTTNYDDSPNRPFTLKMGGQILPTVYFNNIPATPSATTNYITFQIDMGPQIYLGQFNPGAGDLVRVFGSFESPKWSGNFPPVGFLTNNPTLTGNASNRYSGTFADANYPGTVNQYKFVITPFAGGTNYEAGSDRTLVTPTNSGTLPLAYFSGVSTYAAVPITFLVDMTVPIAAGLVNLASGDTVGCAGTFQTNSFVVGANGFILTNNPSLSGTASNIFRGTYIDRNAPGSPEQYKFVINNSGGTVYESPASTGGNNRQFLLGSVAATNPLVLWSDLNPNDVVLVPTTVTFTVNMTNASDRFGSPFDPDNDRVMVDGNFTQPQWPVMSHYDDATIELDYPNNLMNRNTPSGLTYSLSFIIPAGSPIEVDYKYGILRNAGTYANTNIDNEAGFGLNHTRYIRSASGTYNFPLDKFGLQTTNLPAATEPKFGNLAIGALTAGKVPITWLGLPSVHLQTSTNLSSTVWQDQNATAGLNSTNWPVSGGSQFFRLVQP